MSPPTTNSTNQPVKEEIPVITLSDDDDEHENEKETTVMTDHQKRVEELKRKIELTNVEIGKWNKIMQDECKASSAVYTQRCAALSADYKLKEAELEAKLREDFENGVKIDKKKYVEEYLGELAEDRDKKGY